MIIKILNTMRLVQCRSFLKVNLRKRIKNEIFKEIVANFLLKLYLLHEICECNR